MYPPSIQIELTGPSRTLDELTEILTDTLDMSRIIVSTNLKLAIADLPVYHNITFAFDSVNVDINVEQVHTFEYKNVPVNIIHADPNTVRLVPDHINIKVTVPESDSRHYRDLHTEDLNVVVDGRFYNNEELSLPPRVQSSGDFFKDAMFEPSSIMVLPKE